MIPNYPLVAAMLSTAPPAVAHVAHVAAGDSQRWRGSLGSLAGTLPSFE